MGRKRNIIKGDFGIERGRVDVVTLKTKPYYVEQIDGKGKPYAEITASRVVERQPTYLHRRGENKPEPFLSDLYPQHRYQKYCSGCGEWIDRWKFGEDKRPDGKRNRDGLVSWCYECEALRLRRHRTAMKYALKAVA